ncbi:MAG: hypothetical protein KC656_11640 [Myxococcales bacterium]|nr:hypothetical protein [Myxococcales bacterium]MCB9663574.1 hypothetical protein [Alphaproteobacteria bacterium]
MSSHRVGALVALWLGVGPAAGASEETTAAPTEVSSASSVSEAAEAAEAAEVAGRRDPPPVIGPTLSLGHTLLPGKPAAFGVGVQAVFARGPWRFALEGFFASPVTAFAPAVGGDVGVGAVDRRGIGGALGVYGRHVLPTEDAAGSTQLGPGVMMLAKLAPTIILATPLVLWVDVQSGALTPTLSLKLVLGVPWAR